MKSELKSNFYEFYEYFKMNYSNKNPIKIEKEEENKVQIYTTAHTNNENDLSYIEYAVSRDIGMNDLYYRGTAIENLERILETGHDIPGMSKGKATWATPYFKKAAEYGKGSVIYYRGLIESGKKEQVIIIYDTNSLEKTSDDVYKVIFNKEPKEALKGIIILQSQKV